MAARATSRQSRHCRGIRRSASSTRPACAARTGRIARQGRSARFRYWSFVVAPHRAAFVDQKWDFPGADEDNRFDDEDDRVDTDARGQSLVDRLKRYVEKLGTFAQPAGH